MYHGEGGSRTKEKEEEEEEEGRGVIRLGCNIKLLRDYGLAWKGTWGSNIIRLR